MTALEDDRLWSGLSGKLLFPRKRGANNERGEFYVPQATANNKTTINTMISQLPVPEHQLTRHPSLWRLASRLYPSCLSILTVSKAAEFKTF